MADTHTPGDYFVGRPAHYEEKQQPAPAGELNKGTTPGGNPEQQPSTASGGNNKAGIFGNLLSCFSGGRAES